MTAEKPNKEGPLVIKLLTSILLFVAFGLYLHPFGPADAPKGYKERIVYYEVDGEKARKFYYKGTWYFSMDGDKWYNDEGKRVGRAYVIKSWFVIGEGELTSAFNSLQGNYMRQREEQQEGKALIDANPSLSVEKPLPPPRK